MFFQRILKFGILEIKNTILTAILDFNFFSAKCVLYKHTKNKLIAKKERKNIGKCLLYFGRHFGLCKNYIEVIQAAMRMG
jgi:hypothetical protein